MVLDNFFDLFRRVILDKDIRDKLINKHKVYEHDLEDALDDPYLIAFRSTRKSPELVTGKESRGTVYDLYAETANGRVMYIVGRLFPDGYLYIITAYWAGKEINAFYLKEREAIYDDEE